MKPATGLLIAATGAALGVAGKLGDAPGALLLGIALVVGAVALCAPRARLPLAASVGAAGIAAGLADDAPGAVLLGLLVVAGTLALSVHRARRRPV